MSATITESRQQWYESIYDIERLVSSRCLKVSTVMESIILRGNPEDIKVVFTRGTTLIMGSTVCKSGSTSPQ